MKTRKRKKIPNRFFGPSQHLLFCFSHPTFVRLTIALFTLLALACALPLAEAAGAQSSTKSHAHDFVIFTTVFTDRGFTLYGARVRLRRAEEKKFRWEATSDHQGELAFRVPQDAEYEMTVEARGFKPETRKIDATQGNRADLTIRMEPAAGAGSGGKQ